MNNVWPYFDIGIDTGEPLKNFIYVVGYPKSGNTWLTRLLADILKTPVRTGLMGDDPEVATEVNIQRKLLQTDSDLSIGKVHYLPDKFIDDVDSEPNRIVYILRDFRDVLISSFFYFKYHGPDEDIKPIHTRNAISKGMRYLWKHYYARIKFNRYIHTLGNDGVSKDTGNWGQHIMLWNSFLHQNTHIWYANVKYESLLTNTYSVLRDILAKLDLPQPSSEHLKQGIERQSINNLRDYFKSMPADANIPFGKDFNIRFLRRGTSGDWKYYLTRRNCRAVAQYHGNLLIDLDYETDPNWYRGIAH